MRPDVVNDGDAGMLQARRNPGFALEPPRIVETVAHHLDRHRPLQLPIICPPDVAHAPRTEEFLQGIAAC